MMRRQEPRPVLKWAGGKTQLLDEILRRLPDTVDRYYEPFLGGAAVFFALAREGRFRRAILADRNPELVDVYRAIQEDVDGLIKALAEFQVNDEATYYRVRDMRPRLLPRRAARFIYLNKTGYNGLYRVNRSGKFNVPFGRYKNPKIFDPESLRAASAALAQAELVVGDFEEIAVRARKGDAVYFDPPYLPVSKTANFTAYDRHPFGVTEHERLARTFRKLARKGVPALLSNSDTPTTRALFEDFQVETVAATRSINSNPTARGKVPEILVSTAAAGKPSAPVVTEC